MVKAMGGKLKVYSGGEETDVALLLPFIV